MMPQVEQMKALLKIEQGLVHIVIATTAANVGLDMEVKDVIILDLPADFESMTQWNGRASWDGSGGRVVIYTPDEIQVENTFDLHGDPTTKKKKMSDTALVARQAY